MVKLLGIFLLICSSIAFPIGSDCGYNEESEDQVYCGTMEIEKLVCISGKCLGLEYNNMCASNDNCAYGFYCNSEYKMCTSCIANCIYCTEGTKCVACDATFYYATTNECLATSVANCFIASGKQACIECNPYFYLGADEEGNSLCLPGPANCITPSTETDCVYCDAGFYWNSETSACEAAIENCWYGESATSCYICDEYYYLAGWVDGDHVCVGPVTDCEQSMIQKPGYCTACYDGYYLSPGASYQYCIEVTYTIGCKVPSGSEKLCATCLDGYVRWPYCYSQVDHCSVAKSSSLCSECETGYIVNSLEKCTWCGFGVAKCNIVEDAVTDVVECLPEYMKENNSCVKCTIIGALTCTKGQKDLNLKKVALTCDDGYYLKNGLCNACQSTNPSYYKSCTLTTSGSPSTYKCADGYSFYATGTRCVQCMSGAKECTLTSSGISLKVVSCKQGFSECSEFSTTGKCVAYPTGVASQEIVCSLNKAEVKRHLSCTEGYALAFNNECLQCDTGEIACNGYAHQDGCLTSYVVGSGDTSKCIACQEGAATCSVDSADALTTVDSCLPGYINKGTEACIICPSNAISCTLDPVDDSIATITLCDDEYAVVATVPPTCKKCSDEDSNALACVMNTSGDITEISECKSGFAVNIAGLACVDCETKVTHSSECTLTTADAVDAFTCDEGYGPSTTLSICIQCSSVGSNVAECEFTGSTDGDIAFTTTTCESGYGYKSDVDYDCFSCSTADAGAEDCRLDTDGTLLYSTSCKDGYPLLDESITFAKCSTAACSIANAKHCTLPLAGPRRMLAAGSQYVTECNSGYGIATDEYSCIECGENAIGCTITGTTPGSLICSSTTVLAYGECLTYRDNGWFGEDGYARGCDVGYIEDIHDYYCVKCDEGMTSCYADVKFNSQCFPNYYLQDDPTECSPCSTNPEYVASCTKDGDDFQINSCASGFVKKDDGISCMTCGSYVQECKQTANAVSDVISCIPGYLIKTGTSSKTCEPCDGSGVKTCTYATIGTCKTGYAVDTENNKCVQCSGAGVATCDIALNILTCLEGYVAVTGTTTTCQNCNSGYSNVAACTFNEATGVIPVSCISGFFLESNEVEDSEGVTSTEYACVSCDHYGNGANVIECSQNSILGATPIMNTCEDGSYQTYTCVPYQYGNCKTPNSPKTCSECNDGFTVAPEGHSSENQCFPCPTNAKTCSVSVAGTLTIGECMIGSYKLTAESVVTCESCGTGCETCTETSSGCTKCLTTYFMETLDGVSSCSPCGSGALSCTAPSGSGNTQTITSCLDGFYLSSGAGGTSCLKCDEQNCKTCSNNICTVCNSGYFVWTDNLCYAGPSNCKTVNLDAKCSGCNIGNYWDAENSKCIACDLANCADCIDTEICTACETGYYLNAEGLCIVCPWSNLTHCVSCSVPDACDLCEVGYYWDATLKICTNCSVGCGYCGKPENCFKCKIGYFKNTDKLCSACPAGCDVCPNAVNCSDCSDKFYLNTEGECVGCYKTCLTCQNTEENGCVTCPANATLVADSNEVSGKCNCKDGYTWDDQLKKCVAGTGSASYIFCGLLSFLVILIALF